MAHFLEEERVILDCAVSLTGNTTILCRDCLTILDLSCNFKTATFKAKSMTIFTSEYEIKHNNSSASAGDMTRAVPWITARYYPFIITTKECHVNNKMSKNGKIMRLFIPILKKHLTKNTIFPQNNGIYSMPGLVVE